MRLTCLLLVAACGRGNFDPRIARDAAVDASIDAAIDAAPDAAVTLIERNVNCSVGTKTATELCLEEGHGSATVGRAYHWFECSGPGQCPMGWATDGISCVDWCGGADCVGWQYCGTGQVITERAVDATTTLNPAEIHDCVGYNPGWLVRVYCLQP